MSVIDYALAIRLVRRARRMTQAELARAAGVSRETVSRLERGGRTLRLEDVLRVLEREGTSVLAEAEDLQRDRAAADRRARSATRCEGCRKPLPARRGPGRPRKRCRRCASDNAAVSRAWRERQHAGASS